MQEENRKAPESIQKPHFGPENQEAQQAVALGETLLQFSQKIEEQCRKNPELPQLNQLIMERDQILGKLTAMNFQTLPAQAQEWLLSCLQHCQSSDQANLASMQSFKDTLKSQIQGAKEAGKVMGKYRATPKEQSTRWEKA